MKPWQIAAGLAGAAVAVTVGAAAYGLWIIKSLVPNPGGK